MSFCFAQGSSKTISIDSSFKSINVAEGCDFIFIEKDFIPTKEFLRETIWQKHEDGAILFSYQKQAYLFRIIIDNKSELEDVIFSCEQPNIDHFELFDAEGISLKITGDIYDWETREFKDAYPTFRYTLTDDFEKYIFFKIHMIDDGVSPFTVYNYDAYYTSLSLRELLFGIFLGLMCVISIYNLFLFISTNSRIYLYYCLYAISVCLTQSVLFGNIISYLKIGFFAEFDIFICSTLLIFSAFAFIFKYFNLERNSIFRKLIWPSYIFIIAALLLGIFTNKSHLAAQLISVGFLTSYIVGFWVGFRGIKTQKKLAWIFIISWGFLMFSSTLYLLVNLSVLSPSNFTLFSMPSAAAIETIIMSFAVGYRIKILKDEKEQSEANLLVANSDKKSMEFQNKETKLESLRNQLNPHFIFNALNSAQSFVIHNKTDNAADFIGNLAGLMRRSLDYTEKRLIPLSDEINFIEDYLAIEHARFDENFVFSINVQTNIKPKDILVPPLLLQPFIENSIKHAFKGRQHGKLNIRFSQNSDEKYLIELEDDGIGFQEKVKKPDDHNSKGISIITQRINIINSSLESKITFEIFDKKVLGQGTGVLVKFNIPIL